MAKKVKKTEENEEIEFDNSKAEELESQLKRTLADYQNLEKRTQEERVNWIKTANKDFILRLLPTLDHMEQALKGATGDSNWLMGIELAVKEFKRILQEEGLEQVQTESFDPNVHEAVTVAEGPDGKILEVLQMGYNLNGKLIRPAKVIVGKGE